MMAPIEAMFQDYDVFIHEKGQHEKAELLRFNRKQAAIQNVKSSSTPMKQDKQI